MQRELGHNFSALAQCRLRCTQRVRFLRGSISGSRGRGCTSVHGQVANVLISARLAIPTCEGFDKDFLMLHARIRHVQGIPYLSIACWSLLRSTDITACMPSSHLYLFHSEHYTDQNLQNMKINKHRLRGKIMASLPITIFWLQEYHGSSLFKIYVVMTHTILRYLRFGKLNMREIIYILSKRKGIWKMKYL